MISLGMISLGMIPLRRVGIRTLTARREHDETASHNDEDRDISNQLRLH